jgi:small GTP-binding protein
MRRYMSEDFREQTEKTIGLDFVNISVAQRDGNVIKVQIWDTAGDERYMPMTPGNLLFKCDGVVVVHDISHFADFSSLQTLVDSALVEARRTIPMLLLGNKLDNPRKTSFESACQFANSNNLFYEEVSAKTGYNVAPALNRFIHGQF